MQMNIGQNVFHPSHGVGKITAIKELEMNGAEPRLYYEVSLFHTTVWVLVEPQERGKLRPITSRSELARYRAVLKSPPVSMNNNFRIRQNDLDTRLKLGTFQAICEIVRDLSARRLSKSLTDYESGLLKKTREFLCQEWAAINGISGVDAARDVEALLVEGQGKWAKA